MITPGDPYRVTIRPQNIANVTSTNGGNTVVPSVTDNGDGSYTLDFDGACTQCPGPLETTEDVNGTTVVLDKQDIGPC